MNKILEILRMKRITYKLFFHYITHFILFCCSNLCFLIFFLPTFYEKHKINQLQIGIEEMIEKSKNLTFQEAKPRLAEYEVKNNALLLFKIMKGGLFIPLLYLFVGLSLPIPGTGMESIGKVSITNIPAKSYSINKLIQFKDITLTINVEATLQPIDEASQVLILFIPYISMIVIIIELKCLFILKGNYETNPIY